MLAIASHLPREAAALSNLCHHRGWSCQTCSTIGELMTTAEKSEPYVIVMRARLSDGYSDDLFEFLQRLPQSTRAHVVLLMPADAPAREEARQISLGADCVLRDPLRIEVLLAYLARFRQRNAVSSTPEKCLSYLIAGAEVFPNEHRLAANSLSTHVAPQEISLLRLFSRAEGKVIPYAKLYTELFGRRFDGETANCRVLLVKLAASFRRFGIDLRKFIQVIPKSGYLYTPAKQVSVAKNPTRLKNGRRRPPPRR